MDHFKILRRAFDVTWNYRALWVFGVLLALTAAQGGGGNGGVNYQFDSQDTFPELSPELLNTVIIIAVGVACLILLLVAIGAVAHYVSQTSLIRMVDQHEVSGEKLTVRQGFRLGWSRAALRLFLADLLINIGVLIVFLLLLLIAAAPSLVWLTESVPARILGTVLTAGLVVLVICVGIVVAIALSLLEQFFYRAIVLENMGVIAGIRRGWQLVRQRLGDVVVMGLILFGLNLAWTIVMIPVTILLILAGTVVGGLPALLAGTIVGLFVQDIVPWIVAGVIGLPLFILIVGAPLLFLDGLKETFLSSTWTLTYREVMAPGAVQPADAS